MDKSWVRTVVLFVALGNQVLVSSGQSPLPYTGEEAGQAVSAVVTVAVALWTWWKNNYLSPKGKAQEKALEQKNLK